MPMTNYTFEVRTDELGTHLALVDDTGRMVDMFDFDEHIGTERLSVRDIRRIYDAVPSEDTTITFYDRVDGEYVYTDSLEKVEDCSYLHTEMYGEWEAVGLETVAGMFVCYDAFTVERCGPREEDDE